LSRSAVIFDLDGTLWDTMERVLPVWNEVFARYPDQAKPLTREDMAGFMGLTLEQIAAKWMPNLALRDGLSILEECSREESAVLRETGGSLYPGVPEILEALTLRYDLFLVSNCQQGYLDAFLDVHGVRRFFRKALCADTGRSKAENIRTLLLEYRLPRAVYVGDTPTDKIASITEGIPFIYAAYGFGDLEGGLRIGSLWELPGAASQLLD